MSGKCIQAKINIMRTENTLVQIPKYGGQGNIFFLSMKFYITGIRRGLGKYLHDRLNVVETLEECDVFINCKHDKFSQVDNLYKACELNKKVISLGSYASDWIFHPKQNRLCLCY